MNRRDFIKTGLGGALLVASVAGGYQWWSSSRRSTAWVLGGGRFMRNGRVQNLLAMVDPASGKSRYVELDFLPHGVIFDPVDPSRALVFEKIGPGACEINLHTGAVNRLISPVHGQLFYGHGVFSTDGKVFYTTETRIADQVGVMVIRDSRTTEVIGEFPTYGENPHECHLVDQGQTLLVTNGGGAIGTEKRANISSIDIASRKLIRKWVVPNDEWNAGHVAPYGDRTESGLVVVSAPRRGLSDQRLGGISVLGDDGKLKAVGGPEEILKKLQGEALSVCIHHERGIFGVTHPLGNLLTFWSLADHRFKAALPMERPRGLTLNRKRSAFLVSFGTRASLAEIDPATLAISPGSEIPNTGLAGSHLFHWHS